MEFQTAFGQELFRAGQGRDSNWTEPFRAFPVGTSLKDKSGLTHQTSRLGTMQPDHFAAQARRMRRRKAEAPGDVRCPSNARLGATSVEVEPKTVHPYRYDLDDIG